MTSGFTIHEMENVARNMGPPDSLLNDIATMPDMTDGADALGLNMLMNSNKMGGSQMGPAKNIMVDTAFTSSGGSGGGLSGLNEIEISSLDTMEPITLNLGNAPLNGPSAPIDIQFTKASANENMGSVFSGSGNLFSNSQTASGPLNTLSPAAAPRLSPEEERKEKTEFLNKLQRLESRGLAPSRRYTMDNTLDEIKQEYNRLVDARNLETSIKFQRQMLVGAVTGLQWMNDKFDPLDLRLEGWSESVHENIEDFDEIFEELYDKYKERGKMPPEARLIMALAGSGFMCHVSNTFMRSRMPSMDDVLKQNPDMARQFAAAAARQAGPGFGNFMSMAMGAEAPAPAPASHTTGAFFGSSAAQPAPPPMAQVPRPVAAMEPPRATARREMAGPSGVEDILRTFEQVQKTDVQQMMPESQPVATDLQSVGTDDIGSMGGSQSGGARRGRRRAPPTGNTLSLNV
jgi:hypothetical protein